MPAKSPAPTALSRPVAASVPDAPPPQVLGADEALFDSVLERLSEACGRALRDLALSAGRTVIDSFFGGDEQAYLERGRYKTSPYTEFVRARGEQLEAIGLNPGTLRHYVHAWIVWCGLPPAVQQSIALSALVELARMPEPVRRAQLAVQAYREGWTIRQLRAALDVEVAALTDPDAPEPQAVALVVRSVSTWERQTSRWQVEPQHLAALPRQDKTRVRNWIKDVRSRLREMEEALRES